MNVREIVVNELRDRFLDLVEEEDRATVQNKIYDVLNKTYNKTTWKDILLTFVCDSLVEQKKVLGGIKRRKNKEGLCFVQGTVDMLERASGLLSNKTNTRNKWNECNREDFMLIMDTVFGLMNEMTPVEYKRFTRAFRSRVHEIFV